MVRNRLGPCLILFLAAAVSLQAQVATLHSFQGAPGDGAFPYASLIKAGAFLYGMTPSGGANDEGTIFKVKADGKGHTVLHSFNSALPADGANPFGSLIFKGGKLYGLAQNGGAFASGVVFRINTNGSGFTVLHSFAGGEADGAFPFGTLSFSGGCFFGMTLRGGTADNGTIFRLKTNGTGFAVLHSFVDGESDGSFPQGSLRAQGKQLFGMTGWGGENGLGAVFKINTNGTGYALLHSFSGTETDGCVPLDNSLIVKGKTLYGMTEYGGLGGGGVVFKMAANGADFALLHSFGTDETDGRNPHGSLVLSGSLLLGMTEYGGPDDSGTIFQIGLDGTGYAVRHAFDYAGGAYPKGNLLLSGKLAYGLAECGGDADMGVVFSFKTK